jgi:hypothetical protein
MALARAMAALADADLFAQDATWRAGPTIGSRPATRHRDRT